MNTQKVFFSANIKFLRERKKMSQEMMAESLGIGRSKLNALENGQTKAPQPEDLINCSNLFKISIDSLLKVELSRISELKLRELEAGADIYLQGGNLRVLAITVDKDNKENMEYIPVKAKAGYQAGYKDPDFLASLPRFSLPNLPESGTFRMFPTTGASMLPIPEGAEVICRFLADWQQLKARSLCIVVLKGEQDFVFKQVTIENEGTVLLESLNKLFQPYRVPVAEVLELWQFHSYHSQEVPEQETDLMEIKHMISSLQSQLLKSQS